jgi:hypothetical protein
VLNLLNIFKKKEVKQLDNYVLMTKEERTEQFLNILESVMYSFLNKYENNGPNRSNEIDMINHRCGLPMGSAYCLAAIQFSIYEAESILKHKLKLSKMCSTQNFWAQVEDKYKIMPEDASKHNLKGAIAIWRNTKNERQGHAGLCLGSIISEELFNSIEGNTNSKGDRDGEGFYIKSNSITKDRGNLRLLGFVNLRQILNES